MKPYLVLFLTWALAGAGAVGGSILGNAVGKAGLFAGAFVGGVLGVCGAVFSATRLRWLPQPERTGASIGGICGFALANPLAVSNLHTPLTPVLSCSLAGLGVLVGAGWSRGWRQP